MFNVAGYDPTKYGSVGDLAWYQLTADLLQEGEYKSWEFGKFQGSFWVPTRVQGQIRVQFAH